MPDAEHPLTCRWVVRDLEAIGPNRSVLLQLLAADCLEVAEPTGFAINLASSLSVALFEKTPILRALQASHSESDLRDVGNQLSLFGL